MARDYIDVIVTELYKYMKGDALNKGLEEKRPADRIGVFQELLIIAIKKSTLCSFNGRPYYFDGRIYVQMGKDSWDAFNSLILRVADRCGMQPGDKTKLEGVKKVCRGEVSLKQLEPDNSIIVLRNGVLNLEDNTFSKFNKKFKQITQMDFDYNPNETPNVWTDYFLDAVLDQQSQKILQEFMGAIFIDRRKIKIEKMLILYGAGSNGKSVIQSTLIGLLGEENVKTIAVSDLIGGSERKQNIASINGKRLNYCSEIQTKEFGQNADALKALISGEPFEVRLVYVNNFTARNIPLLMANANRIPCIKDFSHGLARRLIILPFENIVEEKNQNKQLATELKKEYPAILNWMLAGRRRLIENDYQFTDSQKIKEIVEEKIAEGSSILSFMKAKDYNRSILDLDHDIRWLEAQKLYYSYISWCAKEGVSHESSKKFGTVLTEAGYAKRRTPDGHLYGVYQRYERPVKEEYKRKNENDLVEGMNNLAHWCNVSRQTIEKMMNANLLEGCYKKEGRRYWFILEKSRKAVKKYLREDKRRSDGHVPMELKADRRSFNHQMRKVGLPFRKADDYNPHAIGIIYVTDEFNYQLDRKDFKKFIKFKGKFDSKEAVSELDKKPLEDIDFDNLDKNYEKKKSDKKNR